MIQYSTGNTEALEEIFQRYKKAMFNYAFRMLSHRADAEDVVGEVFYILTREKDRYRPKGKFSTWLYTIAHNVCVNRIRKRARVVFLWQKKDPYAHEYEQWDIPDTKDLPDTVAGSRDMASYVKKAVEKLPMLQREAVILREYHGFTYQEMSRVLGCSESKVKILLFRARERLRKGLLPYIEEVK